MPKLRTAVFADGKWFKAGEDAPESVTNPAALDDGAQDPPPFTQQTEVVSTGTAYGVDPALDKDQAEKRGDKADSERAPAARKAAGRNASTESPTK